MSETYKCQCGEMVGKTQPHPSCFCKRCSGRGYLYPKDPEELHEIDCPECATDSGSNTDRGGNGE